MTISRRDALSVLGVGAITATSAAAGLSVATPAYADDLSDLMEAGPLGEHMKGDTDAPVTIIKYASMTCPHCRSWHLQHYPAIKSDYIDKGIAKFYFREFPFDPAAAAAFMLAECSGEDKYFSMIDVLYQQQATWKSGNVVQELLKISKLAGFTQESFNACLKNQELLDNVLSIQKKAADQYGVNSTPTFFINETKYGNMSAEEMGGIIEALV